MLKTIKRILKNNNESYLSFIIKAIVTTGAVYVFIVAWLLLMPDVSA